MGVAFQPYKPLDDYVHIGYRMVHMVRRLLLRPLKKENEYVLFLDEGIHYNDEEAETIIKKMMDSLDGEAPTEVILGVKAFVDHSDCDGEFGNESCQYIWEAFEWALNMYEAVPELKGESDPMYFEVMERLRDLFKKAYEENGIMMLF